MKKQLGRRINGLRYAAISELKNRVPKGFPASALPHSGSTPMTASYSGHHEVFTCPEHAAIPAVLNGTDPTTLDTRPRPLVTSTLAEAKKPVTHQNQLSEFEVMCDRGSFLSAEQHAVCDLALQGASLYIGGNAGTGKSYVIREISRRLTLLGLQLAVTASTGVAALNIGGNTFHSTLGAPVSAEGNDEHSIMRAARCLRFNNQVLCELDVLIVDEVSLLHAGYLEALDRAARRSRKSKKPFGGIQMILSGDFMQLTPFRLRSRQRRWRACETAERYVCRGVLRPEMGTKGTSDAEESPLSTSHNGAPPKISTRRYRQAHYIHRPMYDSYVFRHCLIHIKMGESVRHREDAEFLAELNLLRRGSLPFRLSRSAYLNAPDPAAIRLFATKEAVQNFNDAQMLSLPGEERSFPSRLFVSSAKDCVDCSDCPSGRPVCMSYPASICWARHQRGDRGNSLPHEVVHQMRSLCTDAGLQPGEYCTCLLKPGSQCSTRIATLLFRCVDSSPAAAHTKMEHLCQRVQEKIEELQGKRIPHTTNREGSLHNLWLPLRCEKLCRHDSLSTVGTRALRRWVEKVAQRDFVLKGKALKVGCRVMLMRNLNSAYVNGSLGTVVAFSPLSKCAAWLPAAMKFALPPDHFAHFRRGPSLDGRRVSTAGVDPFLPIVQMDHDKGLVAIPWITLVIPGAPHTNFFVCRIACMPLTPAYAFTVHKIQGITLDHSVLFDAKGMFPCDHLVYVAASRVKRFSQLRCVNLSPRMITVHKPSLAFMESLNSIDEGRALWNSWWSGSSSQDPGMQSRKLYLPDWKKMN